ncbi:MAG: 30S ribosomal protein S21 [Lachnospiraceae bacterium]
MVKENETSGQCFTSFQKKCKKPVSSEEIRKREHYEKPSVRRKKKVCSSSQSVNNNYRVALKSLALATRIFSTKKLHGGNMKKDKVKSSRSKLQKHCSEECFLSGWH